MKLSTFYVVMLAIATASGQPKNVVSIQTVPNPISSTARGGQKTRNTMLVVISTTKRGDALAACVKTEVTKTFRRRAKTEMVIAAITNYSFHALPLTFTQTESTTQSFTITLPASTLTLPAVLRLSTLSVSAVTLPAVAVTAKPVPDNNVGGG
ncbi:hypothetical protein B0J14DRAFT_655276 [Halenospora varia]|nr:hypothetical protein B0J14DRAFT_655276 [Halenospora varia]